VNDAHQDGIGGRRDALGTFAERCAQELRRLVDFLKRICRLATHTSNAVVCRCGWPDVLGDFIRVEGVAVDSLRDGVGLK